MHSIPFEPLSLLFHLLKLLRLTMAVNLNVFLKFDLIIALLVTEHILSSTVALTNYLQKRDIDLLEVVTT